MTNARKRKGARRGALSGIVRLEQRRDGPEHSAKLPARPVGPIAAEFVADAVFRRKVAELYRKGPRVLAELLAHIAAERGLAGYLDQVLDHFLALDDAALDLLEARELPPTPLTAIGGSRR